MLRIKMIATSLTAVGALALLTGCPATSERLTNQGSGSLISAGSKVAGDEITSLTADELQILSDTAVAAINDPQLNGFLLSDDEAAALLEFLEVNGLNTIDEVQAVVNNPGALTIPDSLQSLIDSGAF